MSRIAALVVVALAAQVPSAVSRQPAPHCLTPEQAAILSHMSLSPDGTTLQVTGLNVQVVNGAGTTTTPNGLGNLIVGYNEGAGPRTGSHCVVIGPDHSWEGSACLIAGEGHAAVTLLGGPPMPDFAVLAGGRENRATGPSTAIVGGYFNESYGGTIVGGDTCTASGGVLVGGWQNKTYGSHVVIGGEFNTAAAGYGGVITGGKNCLLDWYGDFSTIGGGVGTYLDAPGVWAANGLTAP